MTLLRLPNEILTQVIQLLSIDDLKSCMLVNYSWHERLETFIFQNIHIKSRNQFKQFFILLKETYNGSCPVGLSVRRLILGTQVGVSLEEFRLLSLYCSRLEYLDFNFLLWKYFPYITTYKNWQHLSRYPPIIDASIAETIAKFRGSTITELTLENNASHRVWFDILISAMSILEKMPNLKYLSLNDNSFKGDIFPLSMFEYIHDSCPQLETLKIHEIVGEIEYGPENKNSETVLAACNMKELSLNMAIRDEKFLLYWASKYPNIEALNIDLKLRKTTEYYENGQQVNPRLNECFSIMAASFPKLKKLNARFDEQVFPCDVFLTSLNGLEVPLQLEDISIRIQNFAYRRRSAPNFKFMIAHAASSLRCIELENWCRTWDYETDLLQPLSECINLEQLSLSPQPGTLTEFEIDIILNTCPRLKQLHLINIYNLFVRDTSFAAPHPLESLTLEYTMVNKRLFDYLALRCPKLHTLDISNVTKPYENNEIELTINMPEHTFRSIRIESFRLGLRLQDSGFQCGVSASIFSLEETLKTKRAYQRRSTRRKFPERWYHLYGSEKRKQPWGLLQRLSDSSVQKIKSHQMSNNLWRQISSLGCRIRLERKKDWYLDLPFGYLSVRCKSVDEFVFFDVPI